MKKQTLFPLLLLCVANLVNAATPKVVAHRGFWNTPGSAQNSIAALQKADSIKVDAVELDVWLSADSVLFVNHDPEIAGLNIEKSQSADLDKVTLANGEKLPRLSDYLSAAAPLSVDLVLEVKTHSSRTHEDVAVPMIVDMINQKGLAPRTTYITFSRNAFDNLVALSGRPVQFLSAAEPVTLKRLGASGADFNIGEFRRNPNWFNDLHNLGMDINVWTVNTEPEINWCIEHQADYITTDAPLLAQELVQKACAPRKLTVMTYNLRFGELADMDRLAKEIKQYNPDFVALQEVDANFLRKVAAHNKGANYINELAQRTGMFGYYGRTIDLGTGYYGIGILSRFPAEKIEKFELPNPGNKEPRVLLVGTFELPQRKMIFASTHFDYKDHETRKMQGRFVVDKLTSMPYPAILGGDFNGNASHISVKPFKAHTLDLTNDRLTWPAHEPRAKLDFLFAYPPQNFELLDCFVPQPSKKSPSDHLPVISTILVEL